MIRFCLTTATRRNSQPRLPVTRKKSPTKRPRKRFTGRHTNLFSVGHLQRIHLQTAASAVTRAGGTTIKNSSSRVATAVSNWARVPSPPLLSSPLLAAPFLPAPNFQPSQSAANATSTRHPNKTDRDLRIRLLGASGGLPPLYLKIRISALTQRTTPLHQLLLAQKLQTLPASSLAASSPPRIYYKDYNPTFRAAPSPQSLRPVHPKCRFSNGVSAARLLPSLSDGSARK